MFRFYRCQRGSSERTYNDGPKSLWLPFSHTHRARSFPKQKRFRMTAARRKLAAPFFRALLFRRGNVYLLTVFEGVGWVHNDLIAGL